MSEKDIKQLSTRLIDLYDKYRTAMLNRKYYGIRLSNFQKTNLWIEISIAIGTSSALGSWAIWKDGYGVFAWAIIAGFSAVLAVIKPLLQLSKQIERYSKLFAGHSDVLFDFETLIDKVRRIENFTEDMEQTYERALERLRILAPQDDPKPSLKLLKYCYQEVNRQIPPEHLWMPTEV